MYIPKHFSENDLATLHAFMQQYPLALIVSNQDGVPVGNHLPVILAATEGPYGTLVGHMARSNPQWRTFDGSQDVLVIFQGPQSYVTPSWYEHPYHNAPTWNYTAIHAYGRPTLINDPKALRDILATQTQEFEAPFEHPWLFDDDNKHVQALLRSTTGFKIPITKLEGKFKLSQNRTFTDQERVIVALGQSDDPMGQRVAELMRARAQLREQSS
jgi:transcriptional regulator